MLDCKGYAVYFTSDIIVVAEGFLQSGNETVVAKIRLARFCQYPEASVQGQSQCQILNVGIK